MLIVLRDRKKVLFIAGYKSVIDLREQPGVDPKQLTEMALERMRALSKDAVGLSSISRPSRALVQRS